jgi:signal transduction histidine kinase
VGHEVRTPLAAIKGHVSTLLQDDVAWAPVDQRHFLETISAETDRLAQLVTNLLDLSRHEAGLLPLARAPVQLPDLIARAIARLHPPIPSLTVDLAPDLPLLTVDGPRIEVVLRNLLANARIYGNGAVHVTGRIEHADEEDAAVIIEVSDNGPGLAPEEIAHVFERFYRAPGGRQRRADGTGLGLAICKAFVEAHDGTIWAESGAAGTTIAFTLPTASRPVVTPSRPLAVTGRAGG